MTLNKLPFALLALAAATPAFAVTFDVCEWDAATGVYNAATVTRAPGPGAYRIDRTDYYDGGDDVVPVYRVYDVASSWDHLFTTDAAEVADRVSEGWVDEGIAGYAFAGDWFGRQPVYRLYDGFDHLYTTNADEVTFAEAAGYVYEGVAWYAFPRAGGGATTPAFRLYNLAADDHILTLSTGERDALQGEGYVLEGVAGFMFSDAVPCL